MSKLETHDALLIAKGISSIWLQRAKKTPKTRAEILYVFSALRGPIELIPFAKSLIYKFRLTTSYYSENVENPFV